MPATPAAPNAATGDTSNPAAALRCSTDAPRTTARRPHVAHKPPAGRRQSRPNDPSPLIVLKQLPALVALDSIPVPVLATAHDGSVLFTNTAFAEMVGRERDDLFSLHFDELFTGAPVPSAVQAPFNVVVQLAHKDGSVVRALMSRSLLRRAGDRFVLAAFRDLTTHLWEHER